MGPSFIIPEAGTFLNRDAWSYESVSFLILPIKTLHFVGLLSHVGIRGNEKADSAAKSAFDLSRVKVGVPNTDCKHHFNQ